MAPLTLNNLFLTYNPDTGTLDTRANQGELGGQIEADPAAFLCSVLRQADPSGESCSAVREALPRAAALDRGAPQDRPTERVPVEIVDKSLAGLVEVK